MNNLLKTQLCLFFFLSVFVQSTFSQRIIDKVLRENILSSCPACLDNDGNLKDTATKIRTLSFVFLNAESIGIQTSKGFEGFISLKELHLDANFSIQLSPNIFDSLPPNLEVLDFGYSLIQRISKFPTNLMTFRSENFIGNSYPNFPNKLKKIISYSGTVSIFPKIPESLIELNLAHSSLKENLSLPENLALLNLYHFPLNTFPILPPNLKVLILNRTEKTTSFPLLPLKLEELLIIDYKNLRNIPNFPDSLTKIKIELCPSLYQIPVFPKKLNRLDIDGTGITCLPFLPDGLDSLSIDLLCIPNKPNSLRYINTGAQTIRICDNNERNNCYLPAKIIGKTFYDIDKSGIQNLNESNLKEIVLKLSDGNIASITDSLGGYVIIGDSLKTYTFSPISPYNYFKFVPQSRTITTTNVTAQRYDSLDFAMQSIGTFPDLSLSITSGNARPGFASISTLTYKNIGTTILNGTITLNIDSKQTFVSANVPPTSQSGNTIIWNFSNFQPFDFRNINITLKTLVEATLNTSVVTSVKGVIIGAIDVNEANNFETIQMQVRGAYDPNDIQVDKANLISIPKIEITPLSYTIRFQNTGNAEALRVEVLDTLTRKLDITTVEMLGASHPYELQIVSDSGKLKDFTVVKWTFEGINLPDSTNNEKASHGFINYRLKNDPSKIKLIDSILNRAAIYFDFNAPVITNKAKTVFGPPVLTTDIKDLGISIFPNPTTGILNISTSNTNLKDLLIEVININGQVLKREILRGVNPEMNIQELTSGLYFLKIKTVEGIGVAKIFKQ